MREFDDRAYNVTNVAKELRTSLRERREKKFKLYTWMGVAWSIIAIYILLVK